VKLSPLTIRKDQNLYAVYKKQRDDQNSVYSINKFNCSGNLVMDTSKELEDSTLKALCHKIDEASILKALCEKIEYKNFDLAEIRNELSKISDRGREKWPINNSPLISAVMVTSKSFLNLILSGYFLDRFDSFIIN